MWLREKPPHLCEGFSSWFAIGAADEIRTRDILLGRQMLYQLSYHRISKVP